MRDGHALVAGVGALAADDALIVFALADVGAGQAAAVVEGGAELSGWAGGVGFALGGFAATAQARTFIRALEAAFPGKWVETADERFTSTIAEETLRASGKGRLQRRAKSQLDRISATLILQGWLQQRSRPA